MSPETCWADLKRLINEKVVASCWLFTSLYSHIKLQGARRRKHHATEAGILVEDKTLWKHMKQYGSKPCWGRDLPHPSRPALGLTQTPIQWAPGHSRGLGGRGVALTTHPHLPPRLKILELYLYSPSGPSWRVLG